MHVVGASNFRIGSIRLKCIQGDVEFEFRAVRLASSGFVGCGS